MKTFITRILAVVVVVALAATLPVSALAEAVRAADAPARGEIWDGSIAEGFAGGTGTEEDPYLISNGAELAYLAQQVNSGTSYQGSYFELTNDIYLNDTTGWENWGDDTAPANAWTAIGTRYFGPNYTIFNYPFSGSFDGSGFAVYGIYINEPGSDYHGLFGYAKNSAIANLDVSESCIHGDYYVGGVAGCNSYGTIINCRNTGCVTGESYVGGVVGETSYSEIINCCNTGSVTGGGGVVGENYGIVTGCYNTGSVTGENYVGGVVGYNNDTVSNCYNTGSVTGSNYEIGGVVGENDDTVFDCYNTGSVAGYQWTGGVIGENYGTASNCYNTGSVTGENYVGGVTASNYETLANCYNTGSVTGGGNVSGMANVNDGEVSNCYYLDTCCDNGDEYGTALTDEQMREAGSFIGFDFSEVWTMEGNASYPYPELISTPHCGASESVPGDLNNDGTVTPADALLVLRMALGLDTPDPNGDVSGDGVVTATDALLIMRWALGM